MSRSMLTKKAERQWRSRERDGLASLGTCVRSSQRVIIPSFDLLFWKPLPEMCLVICSGHNSSRDLASSHGGQLEEL